MIADLKFAMRQLLKSPGFTAVAVLTLAVGIGTCTAMFSVLRALVLQPFSYPDSSEIVHVWSNANGRPLSLPDFNDLAERAKAFAEIGAYSPQPANLGGDSPQTVTSVTCTSGVLRTFGVRPALGRWFEPADCAKGAPPVAIISHALWQQSFGADPAIVGRLIRVNGGEFAVCGVMPAQFEFACPWLPTETCQLWLPLTYARGDGDRNMRWLCAVGRLAPGITIGRAAAEVGTIGALLTASYPHTNSGVSLIVRSLHDEMTRTSSSRLWALFGAVLLVLLIACANVASMLLARAAGRQSEIGVRIALGATRRQVLRLVLGESFALAVAGTVAGTVLAWWAVDLLAGFAPVNEARKTAMALDPTALGFAVALGFLVTLAAGIPPALATLRISVKDLVHADGRSLAGSRSRRRTLRLLVVGQVAVAFVLANGAALFSTAYVKLLAANQALASEHVLSAAINLSGGRYATTEARVAVWQTAAERAAALPGVSAAAVISKLPLDGHADLGILVNDEVYDVTAQQTVVEVSSITSGYFAAAGIPLLRGRTLAPADANDDHTGIVINRALADKCWPGQDPLGKFVRSNSASPWFTARVVGVVGDVRQWGPEVEPRPEIFWSPNRAWGRTAYLVVRSSLPAAEVAPVLRDEIARIDPDLPLSQIRTLQQVVDEATSNHRAVATLIDAFMAVALGLVGVGLYGTLSYHVLQRTREIGLRIALGARRRSVVGLVLRQGSSWVGLGVLLGLAGSLALSTALQSIVFGVAAADPVALSIATAAVAVATLFACALPARRALRVSPIEALRAE